MNKNQVNIIIIDIEKPMKTAAVMPPLLGNVFVRLFPSTLMYQNAGKNNIQNLQKMKKVLEIN
tara:strand:- start:147 stop:335 length:189 start_codon:yes stop_codon:yes gene_type:complete